MTKRTDKEMEMTSMTPTTTMLPCPKCALPMRVIERSGVHIEQCPECRGVFLDRGELDRLLDLESAADAGRDPRERANAWRDERTTDRPRRDRDDDDDDDWSHGSGRGRDPRRRRGFLGEFFEGFGD
jgi:Zn-finger nucleic acid-binding protein